MLSAVRQETNQEHLSFSSESDQFQATPGGPTKLSHNGRRDVSCSERSVLGGVRRITRKRVAVGRDVVEIEYADGAETILVFDRIS